MNIFHDKCPVCKYGELRPAKGRTVFECSQCWFRCHVEHKDSIAAAMDALVGEK